MNKKKLVITIGILALITTVLLGARTVVKINQNISHHKQFHLCVKYLTGDGVDKNIQLGIENCEFAANNGLYQAQVYLARLYHLGRNGSIKSFPINYQKSLKYHNMALEKDSENKHIYGVMAKIYETGGYGVEKDEKKALQYNKIYQEFIDTEDTQ